MQQVDTGRQITAVTRQVRTDERDGAEVHTVRLEQAFPTAAEELWSALTAPDRIARWLLPVTGDLQAGGRYQLHGNAGGAIETCEPPTHLAVTWEYAGDVSWVAAMLSAAEAGSTTLALEHSARPTEHWTEFGPGAVGVGWDLALLGLSLHLAGNELGGQEAAARWQVGQQGREFICASADAWSHAHQLSGVEQAAADAAADRTKAAYTGEVTQT